MEILLQEIDFYKGRIKARKFVLWDYNAVQGGVFTDKSMKNFREDNGFTILRDWRFGLDFHTYMSMVTMNIPQLAANPVNKFFVDHYNEFQQLIDKHSYNDTIFYVAQLK